MPAQLMCNSKEIYSEFDELRRWDYAYVSTLSTRSRDFFPTRRDGSEVRRALNWDILVETERQTHTSPVTNSIFSRSHVLFNHSCWPVDVAFFAAYENLRCCHFICVRVENHLDFSAFCAFGFGILVVCLLVCSIRRFRSICTRNGPSSVGHKGIMW